MMREKMREVGATHLLPHFAPWVDACEEVVPFRCPDGFTDVVLFRQGGRDVAIVAASSAGDGDICIEEDGGMSWRLEAPDGEHPKGVS